MRTLLETLLLLMLASLALLIRSFQGRNPLSDIDERQEGPKNPSDASNGLGKLWKLTSTSPLTSDTAMLVAIAGGFALFIFGYAVCGMLEIGLALGAMFFLLGPRVLNAWLLSRRVQKFRDSFEFGLEIMLSSLGVGTNIHDALIEASMHSPEPVRSEFRQTADEISIGAREEEAFTSLARRVPCTETEELGDAISLYKNLGGAKALDMIKAVLINLREGANAAYQVRQQTKGAKFSAGAVTVIPILYFVGMIVFAPDLFSPLFTTPMGQVVFIVAMGVFATGVWLVHRILATIEQF